MKSTCPCAKNNPFRFSTKYTDEETGLLYYGHRYYRPDLGRWLSKDPIEESGGVNLYVLVHNNPVYVFDYLGLFDTAEAAIQEAVHQTGALAQESRRKGLEEFNKNYQQNVKGPVVNNNYTSEESKDYFVATSKGDPIAFVVLGVEFGAFVYCCKKSDGTAEYNVAKPLRGMIIPDSLNTGTEGAVTSDPARYKIPKGCKPVAFVHTHTMGSLVINDDGRRVQDIPDLPRNGPLSKRDQDRAKELGIPVYAVREDDGAFCINYEKD